SASAGGSVNGNVTIQRYHNGGTAQTRIFGSPIASSNVFTIGQGTYNVLVYSEDGLSPYTRVSNTFNGSFRRATLGGTNLTVGRGYSIRKDAVGTLSYTGVPNNGTIPVSVTFSTALPTVSDRGWNMLSNPYPSAINWASVDKGTSGASNVSVSIWNGSTYTAASIIPSGIGFFTQATANGTITFNNSDRVGSGTTNNTIYRTESNSKLFYLNVSSTTGGAFDALAVTFDNNATVGFESNYDLIKPYVANGPFMFSRVDGNRLSLSVVPYPTTEIRIPVTLHVFNNGNYKFYPSSFADWYADYDVYLKDSTATGVQNINLRTTSNYTFSKNTNDTDTSSRFSLIFKYMPGVNTLAGTNTSTGNNTGSSGNTNSGVSFVLVNQNQVPWDELTIDGITNLASEEENLAKESLIFGHNSDIYIKFEADRSSSDVIVYDLIGNVIYQKENIPSVGIFKISLNYGNNSLYIVKVLNSKENTVKKLVLF
ncbi:MAG: hypothetical protein SFY32_09100, partial [Bacteroidota bacterium]|nr:hypothetical protein [Bacteroidota bacterium]